MPTSWLGRSIGNSTSADSTRHRYRLDKLLGEGGMGYVFLATDTLLGQQVALKLLKEKLATGNPRERFEREIAVCAAIGSENIVQVCDRGVTPEGYPFFVMEYLQGQTLGQLLKRKQQLSVKRTVNIVCQVCAGLRLAHEGITLWRHGVTANVVKVVHRDLKPDNIFLVPTAMGELVKILDFGIAKIWSDQIEATNATSAFIGTYKYAAPEQFEVQNLDERADIYSLGTILYQMLSGTDPFGFGSSAEQLGGISWGMAHLHKPPLPLREQPGCEHLSVELEAIVMRCLQKAPEQRFSSVSELNVALQAAVLGVSSTLMDSSHHFKDVSHPSAAILIDSQLLADREATALQGLNLASSRKIVCKKTLPDRFFFLRQPALLLTGAVLIIPLSVHYLHWSYLTTASQARLTSQEPAAVVKTLPDRADTVWSVAIGPNGHFVSSNDKTIELWNVQTGQLLRTLSGHSATVRAVTTSANGQMLASGSADKTIKLWNLQTGQLLRTFSGHSGPVWSVAISRDGHTLASSSYDGTIKLWNLNTGKLLHTLSGHYDSVWSVAISPDGHTLASSSYDSTIKLWNLSTGELLRTLSGHHDSVRSVAVSPDGHTLASGSWDNTIKIWDLQTGHLLRTLSGHSDRVVAVAIGPDGHTLASGGHDKMIKIWDLRTGQLERTLSGHSGWVVSVAFAPDGQTLISGSQDRTIKIWPL